MDRAALRGRPLPFCVQTVAVGSAAVPVLILASESPRRRDLLALLTTSFTVVAADLDETPWPEEPPTRYVERLALAKADAVVPSTGAAVVIGADTTIDLDGLILGKADGPDEAAVMLGRLSGRSHVVHTGVAVVSTGVDRTP